MGIRTVKYNPAFLSEENLVRSFVVRHTDLERIVRIIRENVAESNQHVLVTGPRGIGKTTLALRVVAEVRRDKELGERWYPVVFAEESYQVGTPGEFWLEALFHLAAQTGDARWRRTYETLRDERDEERLRERALAQLMDFADAEGKRLLLIVENFEMLLGDQISGDDGWALRHTLLHEPRIMLLGTALTRFDEIQSQGKPMFELFKPHRLLPLDEDECREVWTSITGQEPTDGRIRPIQILTGGNPRLVAIISSFAARLSFKELMTDLMQLVDEHTEYFKSHLDNLPSTERKVYLALADLWKPATAREVATAVRLGVSKTSAFLRRLVDRGAVLVGEAAGRTKSYFVAERMYNIYYLMRRRRGESGRVQALVNFMIGFYPPKELVGVTARIAEEACALEPGLRQDHVFAYEGLVKNMSAQALREELAKATPRDFFKGTDISSAIRELGQLREWQELEPELVELINEPAAVVEDPDKLAEAERVCRRAINLAPGKALPQVVLGWVHECRGDYPQAEQAYREATELDESFRSAWARLGNLRWRRLQRYGEAEEAYRQLTKLEPGLGPAWTLVAHLCHRHLKRYDDAEAAYRRWIELDPRNARAWTELGTLLAGALERYDDAENAYRMAIEIDPEDAQAWGGLGELLDDRRERYKEAESAYRKAVDLDPRHVPAWARLGMLLELRFKRYEDAETAYRKAIELEPQLPWGWGHLGRLLHTCLGRFEEAESAYRTAIEHDPEYAWGWAWLGYLLHFQLGRYQEAEAAYRTAIGLDGDSALPWGGLGWLLHDRLGRYQEAEEPYRKAIELYPENASVPWNSLGRLLHEHLDRPDEAEAAYRAAIELDPDYSQAWHGLILLLLGHKDRDAEALEVAERCLDEVARTSTGVAAVARLFYENGPLHSLPKVERWLREAIEKGPEGTVCQRLLAGILCKSGKGVDSLDAARRVVEDAAYVTDAVDDTVDLFVALAAGGKAREALEILEDSPSAELLEPLIVGLRLFLGEKVNVAAEILEVGKDVLKRIQERQEEMRTKNGVEKNGPQSDPAEQ